MTPFTAGKHVKLPDEELVGTATITLESLLGGKAFTSQGIQINSSSDTEEESLGYATIKGILVGETDISVDTYTLSTRMAQPFAFKKIWANGTTARGIKFLGEI